MLTPNSLTEGQQANLHATCNLNCMNYRQESEVTNSLQRKMQKFLGKVSWLECCLVLPQGCIGKTVQHALQDVFFGKAGRKDNENPWGDMLLIFIVNTTGFSMPTG